MKKKQATISLSLISVPHISFHLSKAFKKRYAVTPVAYRRQARDPAAFAAMTRKQWT